MQGEENSALLQEHTPSASSFTCSAQIKWGTFVLWPPGRGKGQSSAEREHFPAHCIFQKPHEHILKTELWVRIAHFLELLLHQQNVTDIPVISEFCYRDHGSLKAIIVKIICIFFPALQAVIYQTRSTILHLSHYFRPPNSQVHSVLMCWLCFQNTNSLEWSSRAKGPTLATLLVKIH